MFAEFETIMHALAERGEPLTLEVFRAEYRKLLEAYFGPEFALDAELSLECLRIPHFYRAFYVYKYATGMAAAITLADRIANGGSAELAAYQPVLERRLFQGPARPAPRRRRGFGDAGAGGACTGAVRASWSTNWIGC